MFHSAKQEKPPNKRLQLDNLQAVRFAVSLSRHFTAKRPAYKLRLKRALGERIGSLFVLTII